MSDTEPGAIERMVNRAMYAPIVSDGMDEINKSLTEARARDAEDARREAVLRQTREVLRILASETLGTLRTIEAIAKGNGWTALATCSNWDAGLIARRELAVLDELEAG